MPKKSLHSDFVSMRASASSCLAPVVPTGRIREATQHIANKVAIVTGGGSEVGRATVSLLADTNLRGG
jgi:hypothetical protein